MAFELAALEKDRSEASVNQRRITLARLKKKMDIALSLAQNQIGLIMLKGLSYEEVKKQAKPLNLIDEIRNIVNAYEHSRFRRGLGFILEYSPEVKVFEAKTSPHAFAVLFSNLITNSLKYASSNSVIKALGYFNKERTFNFELENMVDIPINPEKLKRVFERGYTQEEVQTDEIYRRNEGLGLSDAKEIVEKVYRGRVEVSSDHRFQITYERAKGMEREEFPVIPRKSYVPHLPSFHATVSIPLEALI